MKAKFFLQKIKNEFPQVEWKKYRILTHGWDHVVIVFDEKLIFRFPKDKEDKEEFRNEIQLLKFLGKRVKVGIPEYTFVSKDKSLAGYEMLNGQELKSSQYKRFTTSEKEKFAKQMADFLTDLHSTPNSAISKFNVRIDNPSKDYKALVNNTEKFLFPRLNKKEVLAIQNYLGELKIALDQNNYSNVLTHSDLTWEHILWDKNKVNIIDFSDRTFGDPASDFAGLWEYGQKLVNKVYKLYKGKKDDQLLHRSQLYFKRIPLFIMKDALDGYPCTFKEGYEMFRKRYKIAKIK
jgi:aminoglycoside 2''-phosphotransferase